MIHKWNNLTVRYTGLIPPPHVPIIFIEPKHIWNTTFRLIILGKLDGETFVVCIYDLYNQDPRLSLSLSDYEE